MSSVNADDKFKNCLLRSLRQSQAESIGNIRLVETENGHMFVPEEIILSTNESNKLIKKLKPFLSKATTTNSRIEEKVVITEDALEEFFGNTKNMSWEMRDKIIPGTLNKTITEYGDKLEFVDTATGVTINAKPRYRKYYQINSAGESQSIMGDAVAFELKMKHIAGYEDGKIIAQENSVFKPRIVVSDDIADQIKALDAFDPKLMKKITELEQKALDYIGPNGNKGDPEEINAMFAMLEYLIKKEANFFKPKTVTTYERKAFQAGGDNPPYQFTVDKNVQLFHADNNLPSKDMQQYLDNKPFFEVKPDELFVELKTPSAEYSKQTDQYKDVAKEFKANANADDYNLDQGKYALGKNQLANQSQFLDQNELQEVGVGYWFIKNMGNNIDKIKRTDILNKGEFPITIPFKGKNGKSLNLHLTYTEPGNVAAPELFLRDIKITDQFGIKVKDKLDFGAIRDQALKQDSNVASEIIIDGKKVNILGKIGKDESEQIVNFAREFYFEVSKNTSNFRSLSELESIKSVDQMNSYMNKLKRRNLISRVRDRMMKQYLLFPLTIGTSLGGAYLLSDYTTEEIDPNFSDDSVIIIDELTTDNNKGVEIIVDDRAEEFKFFPTNMDLRSKKPGEKVKLKDDNGNEIEFIVTAPNNSVETNYLALPPAK